jgi:phospholipid/cholesterol/gamma-HCH transport system substrate-binding protein
VPRIPTTPSALENLSAAADDLVERVRTILSDENVARISATLDHLDKVTGNLADDKEGTAALIRDLRGVTVQLNATLAKAQTTLDTVNGGVKDLPEIMQRLDRTLAQFEDVGKNANGLIAENRHAISGFTRDGLTQVGPTLVELRVLVKDLQRVVAGLDRNPGGYITGRTRPQEFKPK